jgi:branched-chain amino acid transport system ATP-binding protein
VSESPRGALLSVERLEARHGLLQAVRGVSLSLAEGEKLALVGANGAGKTTLLRALAGAHPAAGGTVRFDGADVTALPAHRRVALGIALVPEGRRLFPDMTVVENLLVAARHRRPGPWNVDSVLDAFPLLRPLRHRRAATLSGGEQQATAIGRALITNPRLLLLDEVSLGLAPVAVDTVYASLTRLLATGTTVVLVEQDLGRAMRIADRVVCLLEGQIVLEGPAAGLTRERVTEAYFGLGHASAADQRRRATHDVAGRSDALGGGDRSRQADAAEGSDSAGQSDATGRGDPGSVPP